MSGGYYEAGGSFLKLGIVEAFLVRSFSFDAELFMDSQCLSLPRQNHSWNQHAASESCTCCQDEQLQGVCEHPMALCSERRQLKHDLLCTR